VAEVIVVAHDDLRVRVYFDLVIVVVAVPSVSVIAVITTIVTTVAIIAVVVISSPLARLDLHGLARAARGVRVAQRRMACVVRGSGAKHMGGLGGGLCEGNWRCQIRPRALRRFAGHAPAGKIDQRCSITVIHWVGILCLADQRL
jgi:hypothetical protein